MHSDIVITGIGIVSGLGIGKNKFWDSIKKEEHGIEILEEWPEYDIGRQYFGKCQDFKLKDFIKLRPPFPNYYSQLGLLATHLALEDSNIDLSQINPFEIGCIVNTNYGSNQSVEKYLTKLFKKGPGKVSPITFTQTTINHIVGDIARYNNFKGPSTIVMGEESYSLAIKSIQNQQAKIMLCGGLDHVRNFHLYVLNENNELVTPVDDDPDQLFTEAAHTNSDFQNIIGEASCFLLLEEKSHAIARDATIYAEIAGNRSACDLKTANNFYERDVDLLSNLLEKISGENHIESNDIDLFLGSSAHPRLMNSYEIPALRDSEYQGLYSSVISRTGDCRGGSAPLSLATAALSLHDKYIPGCGYPSEFFLNGKESIKTPQYGVINHNLNYVAVNSIQIGGSTSCILLKNPS